MRLKVADISSVSEYQNIVTVRRRTLRLFFVEIFFEFSSESYFPSYSFEMSIFNLVKNVSTIYVGFFSSLALVVDDSKKY